MKWLKQFNLRLKLIWLRIRYMTCLELVHDILNANSIHKITKEEDEIILNNCKWLDAYTICWLIKRKRNRDALIARLRNKGILESNLTKDEIEWIDEILNNHQVNIDDAVEELRDARSNNRKPKDASTMKSK